MPSVPIPSQREEPSAHNIWPLKQTLTEAEIRFITFNLSNSARTEFINLAKLSQRVNRTQNWALDRALQAQI
jgi:hypothetical protein